MAVHGSDDDELICVKEVSAAGRASLSRLLRRRAQPLAGGLRRAAASAAALLLASAAAAADAPACDANGCTCIGDAHVTGKSIDTQTDVVSVNSHYVLQAYARKNNMWILVG